MAQSETVYEGIVQLRAETAQLKANMSEADAVVKTGMASMGSYAENLGKSLLPAFGAAAVASVITGFAKSIFDTAGQIKDMSAQTGISTELLSGMKSTLEENGSSLEAFSRAAFTAQKNLGGIDEESDNAAKAFEAIGLSAAELKAAAPDKFIETVAKALAGISDPAERASKGAIIFGKAWREIAPAMAEAADNMAKLKAAGMSAGDIDALDQLGDQWTMLKNKALVEGSIILGMFARLMRSATFGARPVHIEAPEITAEKGKIADLLKKDEIEKLAKAQVEARKSATDLIAIYQELNQSGMTPLNKTIDDLTQHFAALGVTAAESYKGQTAALGALNKELDAELAKRINIAKVKAVNELQGTGAGTVAKFEQQFDVKFDSSKKAAALESAQLLATVANQFKNNPAAQAAITAAFGNFMTTSLKDGVPDIPELLKSAGLQDLSGLTFSLTAEQLKGMQDSEQAGQQWGETMKKETVALQESFGQIGTAVGDIKKDMDALRDAAAQNLMLSMDTSGSEAGIGRVQAQLEVLRNQVAAINANPVRVIP